MTALTWRAIKKNIKREKNAKQPKIEKDDNLIIPPLALEATIDESSTKYNEIEKLVSCFYKRTSNSTRYMAKLFVSDFEWVRR